MGNATQGSTGHLSGLGSSLAGHRPGGGSWCSGPTGPSGQPVGRGGWSTVQPAGRTLASPGPTKLGALLQEHGPCRNSLANGPSKPLGAWLLSWEGNCLGQACIGWSHSGNLCICGTGCCLASAAGSFCRWLFPGRLWPAGSHRLWPGNQLWSWAAGFWANGTAFGAVGLGTG